MRTIMCGALLALFISAGSAIADPEPPEGWVRRKPILKEEGEAWCVWNYPVHWHVSMTGGELAIEGRESPNVPFPEELQRRLEELEGDEPDEQYSYYKQFWLRSKPHTYYAVDEGWFVGADSGEWGGELFWVPPEGLSTLLYVKAIRHITGRGGKVFAGGRKWSRSEEGIPIDVGYVLELERTDGEWRVTKDTEIPEAVLHIYSLDADRLLLVTFNGLMVLHEDGEVEVSVPQRRWRFTGVNSVTHWQGPWYAAGMRYGIAELRDLGSGVIEQTWLVPKSCARLEPPPGGLRHGDHCKCIPAGE